MNGWQKVQARHARALVALERRLRTRRRQLDRKYNPPTKGGGGAILWLRRLLRRLWRF